MGTAERKEREKKRRQSDILDAAEEVFFEKGLKEATMDDVAERAELSKGTIYLHFKNKETLYMGINLRATQTLRDKFIEAVASEPDGASKLMAIGRAYIQFAADYPFYFRTMSFIESFTSEMWDKQEGPIAMQCHETGATVLGIIAEAVDQGKKEGTLRPELNPMKTAVILWASGNGVIQMNQNKGEHFQEKHGMEEDFIVDEYLRFCARAMFITPPEQYR